MPNYNIVVTEGYKPYTFDELIKPLQIYKEEYDKIDAELQDINDRASLADYYIDKKKDADVLAIHDAYMKDLNALADSFTSGGMTAEKRAMAKNLRKRYGSEISNILVAAQERKAEIDEQRQALLKNPSLRFSRNAQETGLNFYYNNPTRDPYVPYDLDKITKQAFEAAAAVTDSYPLRLKVENAKDPYGNDVPGWKTQIKVKGPLDSADTIINEISKDDYKGNYGNYKSARDAILASVGYDKMPDGKLKESILGAVNSGFAKGIKQLTDASFAQERISTDSDGNNTTSRDKKNGAPAGSALGRVNTDTSSVGLTDRDKKNIDKAMDVLATPSSNNDKSENRYQNAISAVRATSPSEMTERANAFGNIDTRLLTVSTDKLDSLWKEYKILKNIDPKLLEGIPSRFIRNQLKQFGILDPQFVGSVSWDDEGEKRTIVPYVPSTGGLPMNALNNQEFTTAGTVLKTNKNTEEQIASTLKKIEREYNKTLQEMLDLPGASSYYNIENFTAQNINTYFNDVVKGADFNTQLLYNASPASDDVERYKGIIMALNEKGTISNGLFKADRPDKPLSFSEREELFDKSKLEIRPAVIPDRVTGRDNMGVIINGEKYIIRGNAALDRATRTLNVVQDILRSTEAGIPSISITDASQNVPVVNGQVQGIVTISGEQGNIYEKLIVQAKSLRVMSLPENPNNYVIAYDTEDSQGNGAVGLLHADDGNVAVYNNKKAAELTVQAKKEEIYDAILPYTQVIDTLEDGTSLSALRLITFDRNGVRDTHNLLFGFGADPVEVNNDNRSEIPRVRQMMVDSFYTSDKDKAVNTGYTGKDRETE